MCLNTRLYRQHYCLLLNLNYTYLCCIIHLSVRLQCELVFGGVFFSTTDILDSVKLL